MAPEHPADFPAMSNQAESGDVDVNPRTPRKHQQYQLYSQPLALAQQPISPPVINRQRQASQASASTSTAPAAQDPSARMSAASQKPREEPSSDVLPTRTGGPVNTGSSAISPSRQPIQRTPKTHTPKKADWTTDKLEEQLQALARDLENDIARLTTRQLRMAWKKEAPQQLHVSKINWFSHLMPKPKVATGGMRFKIKQHGAGRGGKQNYSGKQQKDEYVVTRLKTNRDPVPNYGFHHVEISKNILSPNTMLSFVPHLRDLADEEEPRYRRWLENLESMDNQSGFATLSRQEKVLKTMQKEHGTILLLYLDYWLEQLAVDNCTKPNLIRYMASQADAVTPQQKSSILNSYNDEIGSPRTVETLRMFTEAFDRVFNSPKLEKRAVTLGHVLLLDKSVDAVVDTKKWMKETPNQIKPNTESMTVESFLETYALLGCLICCSHSCEHGEYGVDNERKRFSIEVVGGLEPLLRKLSIETAKKKRGEGSLSRKARKPCSEECYRNGRPGTRARAWSETETMLLKAFFAAFSDTNISIQCATAVATGRPCWDVNRQLEKLDIDSPPVDITSPAPVKIKPVSWYDRFKKMLLGDWQDQTITHDHSRREHFDPCNHEGPCVSATTCSCVANKVMCERFCRCTVATCAIKFTGCACHSQGKTCLQKQKERPCICVQLNRECDPALCGSCGALERSNPRNADNDQLYATGCQNCWMQRGKGKSLILGKSMIENCGYGLFTAEDIAQDEFVIEYVGEIISQDEGVRREARRGDVFNEESNASYLFTLLEAEGIWVDAAIYGNLSRYINHQDGGDKRGLGCNITPKILYVGGEYRIKFTSMRDIKAGEELFFNYGENFPNLTKKLLEEQQEEEKVKKGRSKKNDPNKPKKPRGRPPKKRGRKPKNKAFAKIDSDGDDDEDAAAMSIAEEDPFQDIRPQSRKRKRGAVADMSSEEEYRPEAVDSDAPFAAPAAAARARRRATGIRKRAEEQPTTTRSRTNSLFDRVLDSRGRSVPSTEADSDSEPVRTKTTTKRQPRKARRLMSEVPDDDEPKDNAGAESHNDSAKRRGGSGRPTRQRAPRGSGKQSGDEGEDSDSGAHGTPSKVRTRRQARNTTELSPNKDGDYDDEDSDEHVVVHRRARRVAARGVASDSEDSSGVIDRTRSRRPPARYSD